jgi:hypothetical protein
MKIVTPGHKYVLSNKENPTNTQELQFLEQRVEQSALKNKAGQPIGQPRLITINDGVSNEEVLLAIGDRLEFINIVAQSPLHFLAAHHISCALQLIRQAEGTAYAPVDPSKA